MMRAVGVTRFGLTWVAVLGLLVTATFVLAEPASAQTGAPDAPTGVSAVDSGDGAVMVSWTAPASDGSSPVTGYIVNMSRWAFGGFSVVGQVAFDSTATSQELSGLTNNPYLFDVEAVNGSGPGASSSLSNVVRPTVNPDRLPSAPTGVTAAGGSATITVAWTAPVTDGGSAIVGYAVTAYLGYSPVGTQDVNAPSTTVTLGLSIGRTYRFKVAALTASGTGPASSISNPATIASPPGAPTGVSAVDSGDGTVTVSWTAPSSHGSSPVTGYIVTVSGWLPGNLYFGGDVPFTDPATSQQIHGLNNDPHIFAVRAVTSAGPGPISVPSHAVRPTVNPDRLPSAPTGVTAARNANNATISWTTPDTDGGSPIVGYVVTAYIGYSPISTQYFSTPTTAATIYLGSTSTYRFKIAARTVNGTGPASNVSNPA